MSKVWFITGASRGLGREFALAALERGDRVAATARSVGALDALTSTFGASVLPIALDVTDRDAAFAAVRRATDQFGGLDVVINNAGYGLFGAVEELTPSLLRDQLEVNLFGVLHVTQAALPVMRVQRSGHLIMVSSVGGVVAFPALGAYHASKWALEGLSDSLAQEVAPFGVHVTLVEPGPFSTEWGGTSAVRAPSLAAYAPLHDAMRDRAAETSASAYGTPEAAGRAMLKVVDAAQPPLRVFFGTLPGQIVPHVYARRLETWSAWSALAAEANG